jgi:ribosomal protein L18E
MIHAFETTSKLNVIIKQIRRSLYNMNLNDKKNYNKVIAQMLQDLKNTQNILNIKKTSNIKK